MTICTQEWAQLIQQGNVRAVARAISAVENGLPETAPLMAALSAIPRKSFCIGITGAPGAGKSTLVDRLAAAYRAKNKSVGILAVDPTSPITGGAVLGDRIRMQAHASDPGVFIRSMATRGNLGGLAAATDDAALILNAAGKDVILIETVGVGQSDVDVMRVVDCTVVVVTPDAGDEVQSLKAGLMEIGDIFILNKCDHAGTSVSEGTLHEMLEGKKNQNGWIPVLVKTIATTGEGVAGVVTELGRFQENISSNKRASVGDDTSGLNQVTTQQ